MGRYLKNVKLQTGANKAIQVPLSTSAGGPQVPQDGMIRFNTTLNQLEWFYNGQWWDVANRGTVDIIIETHTGNEFVGTDVGYDLQLNNQANYITDFMVFIGGVYQIPGVHYTFAVPSTLTLVSAPPTVDSAGNANYITIVFNLNSTNAVYG
jgi:hypothetical protein